MAWVANRREAVPETLTGIRRWSERADELAVEHAADPIRAMRLMLALTVAALAIGIPLGVLVHDDAALWLREGMPGTWLSAAMLLAAGAAARAIHRREPGAPRTLASFWGLSGAILAVLAVVELLQPTQFAGVWLRDHAGAVAPFGIENVDAVLMIVLLIGVGLLLAPRAPVLLRHRKALGLMSVAVAVGVVCQGIDSVVPVGMVEFIVEDGLKALGEPFLVAGYLVALRDHLSA